MATPKLISVVFDISSNEATFHYEGPGPQRSLIWLDSEFTPAFCEGSGDFTERIGQAFALALDERTPEEIAMAELEAVRLEVVAAKTEKSATEAEVSRLAAEVSEKAAEVARLDAEIAAKQALADAVEDPK